MLGLGLDLGFGICFCGYEPGGSVLEFTVERLRVLGSEVTAFDLGFRVCCFGVWGLGQGKGAESNCCAKGFRVWEIEV